MRSDDELLGIPAEHFPFNMTEAEQDAWLRLVPEDRLPVARKFAAPLQPDRIVRKITAEIDRRVSEKHLMAARATVPVPPEPKKPLYLTWDFWKWVIASLFLPVVLWTLKLILEL